MHLIEETDARFEARPSTIPNAGLGLFAREPIRQGDCLEVLGVLVRRDSVADLCTAYASRYKFDARPGKSERVILPVGWAALANCARTPAEANATIAYDAGRQPQSEHASGLVLRFARDFEAGEEVFAWYGYQAVSELGWAVSEDPDYQRWLRLLIQREQAGGELVVTLSGREFRWRPDARSLLLSETQARMDPVGLPMIHKKICDHFLSDLASFAGRQVTLEELTHDIA